MAVIGDINLQEPSTVTKRLAAVEITRNSTVQSQEIMVIGSPNSTTTLAVAEVLGSAPASTTVGLAVRVVEPSTGPVAISSIAGRTLVDQNSTVWPVQVSSVAGAVTARLNTSSGGGLEGSTGLPAANAIGLHVRQVVPTLVTVASTAGTDTTATLISSAATTPRIVAYGVVSTMAGPVRAGFYAGSTLLWPVLIWADGGIAKDSQQVAPPGYLFAGKASRPVQFSVASTGSYTIGLTYWSE